MGHVAREGEGGMHIRCSSEGKRPLRIATRRWEYNCKTVLKITGYDGQRPLYPVTDPMLLYL